MSREEWQALFDSANDVALPNLGMEVRQYGDGVKVIQNADGSLGILSDAAGGLLSVRRKLTANQWFWLLDFPALDDLSIDQASQRLPTVIDLVAGLSSPSKKKTSTAESPAPLTPSVEEAPPNKRLGELPSFNATPVQASTSAEASDSLNRENTVNVDPLKATSPLRLRPAVFSRQATPFETFTGDRSTNTPTALPEDVSLNLSFNLEGERLVKDAVRRSNITTDPRLVSMPFVTRDPQVPPTEDDDDAPPPFQAQQGQTNLAGHPRQEDPQPRPAKRKPLP
jgi:hypothetical protein